MQQRHVRIVAFTALMFAFTSTSFAAWVESKHQGMMAQQGQGWINAITGQEVVRDPQSGQRWQVPVGGQYIYGRNTGETIRADRPLQTHELPEGLRHFEPVK